MKKLFVRAASLILALILCLSVLPMAVFAAEADEEVAPAAISCNHPLYSTRYHNQYIDSGYQHQVKLYTVQTCNTCGYSYSTLQSTFYEAHSNTKTVHSIDPESGAITYKYTCTKCGHFYFA